MRFSHVLDRADEYQRRVVRLVRRLYGVLRPAYLLVALFGLHWFSTSGSVYNMINQVGPYGLEKDARGNEHIVLIAEGSDSQYSTEGFMAGLLTCAASIFFILALRTMHSATGSAGALYAWTGLGMCCVFAIHTIYSLK